MSRYNLSARDDARLSVVVGYDNPLETYFAHVILPGPEDNLEIEDENILIVGNRIGEIKSVEDLAKIISGFADIPYNIKKRLIEDQAQPYELSPLQIKMREWGLTQ